MSKMIIIGTGASAAINPSRFPTMDNFFQGVLGCAKNDEDKRLIANFLSILDYERIFVDRHIDCENLAAQWHLFMSPKRSHLMDTDAIRDCYLDILGSRFVSNRHAQENLEILLDRSLNAPDGSSFSSILYMLNWLLGYFDGAIEKKSQALYHKLFDTFIGSKRLCSLVSFNYDLLLDRALVSWLGKSMTITDTGIRNLLTRRDNLQGHWSPYDLQIFDNDLKNLETTLEPFPFCNDDMGGCEGLRLVKPHGSLSFTQNSGKNENNEICLLIEASNVVPFLAVKHACDHESRELQPLIVPPTQNKIKARPILLEAERHFREKLSSPDTKRVMVIGWSLPPTDKDHENIIRQCISNRALQIEELIVIDLRPGRKEKDPHFDRMESMFRPKVIKKCWEGFNEESVEKVIK